jgi:hypothetical protein
MVTSTAFNRAVSGGFDLEFLPVDRLISERDRLRLDLVAVAGL